MKIALAVALCLPASILPAQIPPSSQPQTPRPAATPLTVADVLAMHRAAISDDLILAKLQQANHPIDLTTDDILQLKAAGVSDIVVRGMIAPPAPPKPVVVVDNRSLDKLHSLNDTGATPPYSASLADPENPLLPHDSGIYLAVDGTSARTPLHFLDRANITGISANVGAVFTFFAYPVKYKYIVQPPKASVRTTNPTPVFYFYFENKSAGLGKTRFAAADVSAPTQFELLAFDATKKQRYLPALEFGIFVGVGAGHKDISFDTERLSDGLYRVTVKTPLKPGEYAFEAQPAKGSGQAAINDPNAAKPDVFDFGVDAPSR